MAGGIAELRQDIRELRAETIRRFEAVDRRFDGVDDKFRWMIGSQFAMILAFVAALANAHFR